MTMLLANELNVFFKSLMGGTGWTCKILYVYFVISIYLCFFMKFDNFHIDIAKKNIYLLKRSTIFNWIINRQNRRRLSTEYRNDNNQTWKLLECFKDLSCKLLTETVYLPINYSCHLCHLTFTLMDPHNSNHPLWPE